MLPYVAEVVGTFILLLLGNGVVANALLEDTKGNGGGVVMITIAWGLAVFVAVFIVAPASGAHLNPAVTIGLAIAGSFSWSMVPGYILAQMIGAALGTSTVWLMYKDHYDRTADAETKRATFCTSPAIRNVPSNFFSELVGTFALVFGVFYIVGAKVGDTSASLGALDALPVGLLVLVIGMALGGTTGYAINPARDLAPRIMHQLLPIKGKTDSDWGYAWIPVLGPIAGAAIAAGLYTALGGNF
ncbi:MAG: MIP/aquaporin family protein [Bacteroidota bacterium]